MSVEPLSMEERENYLAALRELDEEQTDDLIRRLDATVQDVEAKLADCERRERAAVERAAGLRDALLYLLGHDIAGYDGHMRVNEVCRRALAADDEARAT